MKNHFLLFLTTILFLSCGEKSYCEENEIISIRKNSLKLNDKTEKYLSQITSILNGYNGYSFVNDDDSMILNITHEIFFNLSENNRDIFLVESQYKDKSKPDGSFDLRRDPTNIEYLDTQIIRKFPLGELTADKISVFEVKRFQKNKPSNLYNIAFENIFNNESFNTKILKFNSGKPSVSACYPTQSETIAIEIEQGKELFKNIVGFVASYNE